MAEGAAVGVEPRGDWHAMGEEEVLAALSSSRQGLGAEEAARRLASVGKNEIEAERVAGPLAVLARQFTDLLILILLAAAVVAAALGDVVDAGVIVAIVILNGLLGFWQEFRAERAVESLRRMAAPHAEVRREGRRAQVSATELVPGDLVWLEAGSIVPADARVLGSEQLRADESTLTGESVPIDKIAQPVAKGVPLPDRNDMVFAGTTITYGHGEAVIVATGHDTEFGKIAGLLAGTEEGPTPLERRLRRFGHVLAAAIGALCVGLVGLGLARGEEPVAVFLTAVSLAVAAIPEALPAVLTTTLALGASRMVQRRALMRRLSAVEALGSVTTICSDKTGTLTENRMRVEQLWRPRGGAEAAPERLLRAMALCNDVEPGVSGALVGDPTEVALYEAAAEAGLPRPDVERAWPRIAEVPFEAERKRMTTVHTCPDGSVLAIVKGAPEVILARTVLVATGEGTGPADVDSISAVAESMAAAGLRVLAVAERAVEGGGDAQPADQLESGLTLLGLLGLLDPPRADVTRAVAECRAAGIRPVMITGDHPMTARAIAHRIGLVDDVNAPVTTGVDLERAPESLPGLVEGQAIYARIAPEQKLEIVQALQRRGEIVSMTGDGVNDGPALRQADIGVAMGRSGTDVARSASDMILLDDHFATIVGAVAEGRRIYESLRRFVRYILTTNLGEIVTVVGAPLLGLPMPLLPAQILFVNLVTDGLPGLALTAEPAEADVMRRPPRSPDEGLFARGLGWAVLVGGFGIGALTLAVQAGALAAGFEGWQTLVFVTLCTAQLWNALALRARGESTRAISLRMSPALAGALVVTLGLVVAAVYVPALGGLFHTAPLAPGALAVGIIVPSLVFFAVEGHERIRARRGVRESFPPAG